MVAISKEQVITKTFQLETDEADSDDIRKIRRLCCAVLDNCLCDLLGKEAGNNGVIYEPKRRKRLSNEAMDWILSDEDRPFSFLWVCSMIKCDHGSVREAVLKKLDANEVKTHRLRLSILG